MEKQQLIDFLRQNVESISIYNGGASESSVISFVDSQDCDINSFIESVVDSFFEEYIDVKQYTITETNDWEGERFSYVMELTKEQVDKIKKNIEKFEVQDELEIEQTNHTQKEINLINKISSNEYMQRIGFYEFANGNFFDLWKEGVGEFYKARGLKRVNKS